MNLIFPLTIFHCTSKLIPGINASRPSEHPPVKGKNVKTFGLVLVSPHHILQHGDVQYNVMISYRYFYGTVCTVLYYILLNY